MTHNKILDFDFENAGGLASVFAFPAECFVRIRKDYQDGINVLELRALDKVIEIPVFCNDSFFFLEEQVHTEAGVAYEVQLSGVIPKSMKKNDLFIQTLERGAWLVLFMDNNGVVKLAGNVEVPMFFSSSKSSGKKFSDLNLIDFSFNSTQASASIYIDDCELFSL